MDRHTVHFVQAEDVKPLLVGQHLVPAAHSLILVLAVPLLAFDHQLSLMSCLLVFMVSCEFFLREIDRNFFQHFFLICVVGDHKGV